MHNRIKLVIILPLLVFFFGCALGLDGGRGSKKLSKSEEWTGITKDEFVDKDTHMRDFYKSKIAGQEKVIQDNTRELMELEKTDPKDPMDIAHKMLKKDRLENEIIAAKKSKRNWEKLQKEEIDKQMGGSGGGGGGCGS